VEEDTRRKLSLNLLEGTKPYFEIFDSEDDRLPVNEGMLFSIVKLTVVLAKNCQNLSD
jgi:hypothetical protein